MCEITLQTKEVTNSELSCKNWDKN